MNKPTSTLEPVETSIEELLEQVGLADRKSDVKEVWTCNCEKYYAIKILLDSEKSAPPIGRLKGEELKRIKSIRWSRDPDMTMEIIEPEINPGNNKVFVIIKVCGAELIDSIE